MIEAKDIVLFKKLQTQFKTTVLMVTHDPTAAGFCDRILRMQDGHSRTSTSHTRFISSDHV